MATNRNQKTRMDFAAGIFIMFVILLNLDEGEPPRQVGDRFITVGIVFSLYGTKPKPPDGLTLECDRYGRASLVAKLNSDKVSYIVNYFCASEVSSETEEANKEIRLFNSTMYYKKNFSGSVTFAGDLKKVERISPKETESRRLLISNFVEEVLSGIFISTGEGEYLLKPDNGLILKPQIYPLKYVASLTVAPETTKFYIDAARLGKVEDFQSEVDHFTFGKSSQNFLKDPLMPDWTFTDVVWTSKEQHAATYPQGNWTIKLTEGDEILFDFKKSMISHVPDKTFAHIRAILIDEQEIPWLDSGKKYFSGLVETNPNWSKNYPCKRMAFDETRSLKIIVESC